jgi:hypothetical protein
MGVVAPNVGNVIHAHQAIGIVVHVGCCARLGGLGQAVAHRIAGVGGGTETRCLLFLMSDAPRAECD